MMTDNVNAAPADVSSQPTLHDVTKPYRDNDNVGVGFDLNSGDLMNTVVQGTLDFPVDASGSTTSFEVRRVTSNSDLESALSINADLSYGVPSFGAGASARFGFSKQQNVQTSSLFLTVRAEVGLATHSLDNIALTDAAAEVTDATIFAQRYGNMFIRSLIRGGLFVGVLRVDTSSVQQATDISASLSGSYDLFSADIGVKLQNLSQTHQGSINVDVYKEGGPPDLGPVDNPGDPMELLAQVKAFLQSFADPNAAVPYMTTLAPITIANGPFPPNLADVQKAQDVIVECAKRRSVTMDQQNLLQYIVDNPTRFDFSNAVSVVAIQAAINGFDSDLDVLSDCASAAMNDCIHAQRPSDYAENVMGITTYPSTLPSPLPVLNSAPTTTPTQSWKVQPLVTGGALFPPGGFVSWNGIAVDQQGQMTALPVQGRQLAVVPGLTFPPGGFVSALSGVDNASIGVMAIDTTGRFTMLSTASSNAFSPQEYAQLHVVSGADTNFHPGGYITRPNSHVSLSIDQTGLVHALCLLFANDPPQVQDMAASTGSFVPGGVITELVAGPTGTLSALAIDAKGILTEITAPTPGPAAPTVAALPGANSVFPPGGYISSPGGPSSGTPPAQLQIAFAVDQQGKLSAIWRPPGQQPWTVTPIGNPGQFKPGVMVSDLHNCTFQAPGSDMASVPQSFAVDASGRLNVIQTGKTTLGTPTVTTLGSMTFPPQGAVTRKQGTAASAEFMLRNATGFAVDAEGRLVKFTLNGQTQQWELIWLSAALFPPGCAINLVMEPIRPTTPGLPAIAIDNQGRANSVAYG